MAPIDLNAVEMCLLALTLWPVLCYDGNSLPRVLQSCCCLLMCCTGQIHTIHLQTHMDQYEHVQVREGQYHVGDQSQLKLYLLSMEHKLEL